MSNVSTQESFISRAEKISTNLMFISILVLVTLALLRAFVPVEIDPAIRHLEGVTATAGGASLLAMFTFYFINLLSKR